MRHAAASAVRFAPDPAGLLERLTEWARTDGAVRALLLLGSRARQDHPADEWSDTDVIVVVDDPETVLADASWPSRFGPVAISFIEETGHNRRERRVLYADATDLDVVPVPTYEVRRGLADEGGLLILGRGYRVLVDKEELFADLPERIASAVEADQRHEWPPPLVDFENLIGDFWYHAVWSARKLRRGELWVALRCVDGYMKRLLLAILEWRHRAGGDGGADPWFDGRFLEQWVDPETQAALAACFAHYDAADIARALRGTMDLFRRLATDLAVRLELPYPARADEAATRLTEELLPPTKR
jgi:aminoglycoside 6-adenylyltransferase